MSKGIPVRFRTYPLAERKRAPRPYFSPRTNAVVLHSMLAPDGAAAVSLVLGAFEGRVVTETLYHADDGEECRDYALSHAASAMAGASTRIDVKPMVGSPARRCVDSLGYDLRTHGYRRGLPIVVSDVGPELGAVATRWGESRRHPGGWTLELVGLSTRADDPSHRSWSDAPRVLMVSAGDRVLAWWGSTAKEGGGTLRRPHPRSGPIVDVLNLGGALAGRSFATLAGACAAYQVEAVGIGEPGIDGLRAAARAIVDLHWHLMREMRSLELGLNPGFVASAGSVATALMARAGMGGDPS